MSEMTVKEAARILGKSGAKKGGEARAKKLSPRRRSEIARNAVNARWNKWREDGRRNRKAENA